MTELERRADTEIAGSVASPSATAAQVHKQVSLAENPDLLSTLVDVVHAQGVVGEDRNAKLIYLALTSRVLDEPVSLAIKGVSSSGKSFTVETVLKLFPASVFITMTAMSERALVYWKGDYSHRTLVLFEAVALREQREKTESNLTAYLVRSLLSEGRISYPVTVRSKDGGWETKTIIKEGPTNMILTTTATSLHGENETRLISLPTNDSANQTRAILLQTAEGKPSVVDLRPWQEFQLWLEGVNHRVVIPYARELAQRIPPVAVRLRRDFKAILRLIETHAILHQMTRDRDDQGRVVATEADYLAVRGLVADLIAEGVGATVPKTLRETVECVHRLAGIDGATVHQIAKDLNLDRSVAQRRVKAARERGYLVNLETKWNQLGRYVIGDPMPNEITLLPEDLRVVHLCTHSQEKEGDGSGNGKDDPAERKNGFDAPTTD